MSNRGATAGREYSLERTRFGDDWRVDSEGYLHVGGRSACVDSVTITCTETEK